jgi:hypothetical protein
MNLHTLMAADLSTVVLGDLAQLGTLYPDGGAVGAPLRGLITLQSAAALADQRGVSHEQVASVLIIASEAEPVLNQLGCGRTTLRRGDVWELPQGALHPGRWVITDVGRGHLGQLRCGLSLSERHATAPRAARGVR